MLRCRVCLQSRHGSGGGGYGGQLRAIEALARVRANTLAAFSANQQKYGEEESRSPVDVLYL